MTAPAERVALITGGGQGIGAATAVHLARNGVQVGVLDLGAQAEEVAQQIVAAGGHAVALRADVTDRDAMSKAVDTVVQEFGGLHILVNNAGVTRDNLLFKMTDEDWSTVVDVHLRGAFVATQLSQPHMVAAGWGRIVSMSSVSALGNRGQANYAAAKAGIQGFTRTLAIELGPFGVTVNAIAPGFVETAMIEATAARLGMTLQHMREQTAATLPVRRTGVPSDIAAAVEFFVSESAGYVTGQILYVDGGMRLV